MPTCLLCSDSFDSGRKLRRPESHVQSAIENRKQEFRTMCQLLEIPEEQREIVVNQTNDFTTEYDIYCRLCAKLVTEVTTLFSQIECMKTDIKNLRSRICKKKKNLSEMIDKMNENVSEVRRLVVESKNRIQEQMQQNDVAEESMGGVLNQKSTKRKCKVEEDPEAKRNKMRKIIWDCMPPETKEIEVNHHIENGQEEFSIPEEIKIEAVNEEDSDFSPDDYFHLIPVLQAPQSMNDTIEFQENISFIGNGLESQDEVEVDDMNLQNYISSPVEMNRFETYCDGNGNGDLEEIQPGFSNASEEVDIVKNRPKRKAKTKGNAKRARVIRKLGSEESDGNDSDWFTQEKLKEEKELLKRKEVKITKQNVKKREQKTFKNPSWISLEYEKYIEKYEISADGTINYGGIQVKMRGNAYECGLCGLTCKTSFICEEAIVNCRRNSRRIIQHIAEKHLDGFKCDLCPTADTTKTYASLRNLLHHRRSHSDDKIECQICGKPLKKNAKSHSYIVSCHLWLHKNEEEKAAAILAGEKPPRKSLKNHSHLCSRCGKSFITPKELAFHEETHLDPAERNKLPCPVCGKFYVKRGLQIHIRYVHEKSKCRSFFCKFCVRRFNTSTLLNVHVRKAHTKERPFSCSVCAKSFYTTTCLKLHSFSHIEEKRFSCLMCSSQFKYKNNLKRHVQTAHSVQNGNTLGTEILAPVINEDLGEFQEHLPISGFENGFEVL